MLSSEQTCSSFYTCSWSEYRWTRYPSVLWLWCRVSLYPWAFWRTDLVRLWVWSLWLVCRACLDYDPIGLLPASNSWGGLDDGQSYRLIHCGMASHSERPSITDNRRPCETPQSSWGTISERIFGTIDSGLMMPPQRRRSKHPFCP